ncbi:serine/threonine-protein kinase [Streptomyces cavernae]|uniref:serine/threonine-protein kinase n=1 Tax=Streptomyces cavernae TaxID=2259034 RepID=UPI000FEBDEEC|nr:serine/threonine-protein kinase [Streptomyces cavernae]
MAPQRDAGASSAAELPEYAGQYRLESCLGSGGMGVVHLARSTSGLKLAVKVVHAQFAKDPEFRGRFRQEIAAARRVSGAFTASVVDADPEGERPWMATLFIPGPTLAEQVKRNGPLDGAQLRQLMAGLSEALRDIHRAGVVHRDLKPSNVLLAEDGPKVIDFGISRPSDSELRTETGKLIGTPPFMAPEQFRSPREVGPAADIFALGSVLVHAATGRGPFDSDSPYIVAYQVVHDEPDLTGLPDNLVPLVLRCLAKEPRDRPTADELMRELRSVSALYDTQAFVPVQRTGVPPEPEPEPETLPKADPQPPGARPVRGEKPTGRRRRRAVIVAGAVVLTVAAGALASARMPERNTNVPQEKASRSAPAGFTAWQAKPTPGASRMPQCSYGGGKLFCAQVGQLAALDPADGSVLWRHAFADEQETPQEQPVLSGGLVHIVTRAGRWLEALDPASGATRWKMDISAYIRLQHTDDRVLLTRPDGMVTGLDSASGKGDWKRRMTGQGGQTTPDFAWFPGGDVVYATSTSDDGSQTRVSALDPETGTVHWNAELKGTLEPVGENSSGVYFSVNDDIRGVTDALVRYDPRTKTSIRVALRYPVPPARASVRGNVVYVLAPFGTLIAVDMKTQTQKWRLETSVSLGSTPVADDRHVYFTAADGRLLAVDTRKGTLVGQTPTRLGTESDRVVSDLSEPVVVRDRVYASAPDGTVFGVPADAPSIW